AADDLIAAYVQAHPDQIGDPVDNGGGVEVHQWGINGPSVQDFAGRGSSALSTKGSAPGLVMVVVGPNGPKLVRNDFYNTYLGSALGTPNHVSLGAPLEEEHPSVEQAVQSFQNGRMVWTRTTGTRIVFNTPAGEAGQPGLIGEVGQVVPADFVGTFGGHFTLNGRLFR